MISTPESAYLYLRTIGLEPDLARRIIALGREGFEYFVAAVKALHEC